LGGITGPSDIETELEYYIDDEAMTEQEFNAKKADRNKDGKLSGWEREVGKEVAAAKAKKK
jgi:hypothetical protein